MSWVRTVRATVSSFDWSGFAEDDGPADEVVGEHGAVQPRPVGGEVARRDVFETGAFFEVADGELDHGVLAVEGVDGDGVAGQVGEEPEVPPVGPQGGLGGAGQSGAAHDQTPAVVDALGHLGLAVEGVVDRRPRRLVDGGDGRGQRLCPGAHRHRVADVEPSSMAMVSSDQNPESNRTTISPVAPARRTRAIELFDEASRAAGGVGRAFPHPGVEHLAGVGPAGQDRVVAQHFGVAVRGALLRLAGHLADGGIDIDNETPAPGPAPAAHARSIVTAITASSWRT